MRTFRVDLVDEQAHVSQDGVAACAPDFGIDLLPEINTGNTELGKHGIFLHRLGRQCAVEIVDERDGLFLETGFGSRAWLRAGARTRLLVVIRLLIGDGLDHDEAPGSTSVQRRTIA